MLSCLCYVSTSNKEDGINLIRNSDRISLDFVISAQGIKFLQDPLRVDWEIGLLSRFVIYLHPSTTPLYFYHRVGNGRHLSEALPSVVGRSSLVPWAGLMERGGSDVLVEPQSSGSPVYLSLKVRFLNVFCLLRANPALCVWWASVCVLGCVFYPSEVETLWWYQCGFSPLSRLSAGSEVFILYLFPTTLVIYLCPGCDRVFWTQSFHEHLVVVHGKGPVREPQTSLVWGS